MNELENAVKELFEFLLDSVDDRDSIPVGVSNRHIHLSQDDQDKLFGSGYQMKKIKDLSQPGQYACAETLTVCGYKGVIEKVRILGPVRKETQIEVLESDCFKLGLKGVVRLSGDLDGTPGTTLIGPKGIVTTSKGVIVAERHIHMTEKDAEYFKVTNGEKVSIEINTAKGGVYRNVSIRVGTKEQMALECHLDTEESNSMGIKSSTTVKLLKK